MYWPGRRLLATSRRRAVLVVLTGYVTASSAVGCTFPDYQIDRIEIISGGQAGSGASLTSGAGDDVNAGNDNSGGIGATTTGGTSSGTAGNDATSGAGGGSGSGSGGTAGEAGAGEIIGGAGGAHGGGPLLFDDFEDGNDNGWFATSGDWQVVNSSGSKVYQVKTLLDASLFSVIGDLVWQDIAIEAKVRILGFGGVSSSDLVGVYGRFDSPASHYYVALRADGKLAIRKKVSTNTTLGTPVDAGLKTGTQYKIRFELQQAELRAYVNDTLMLTASDSELTSGRIAIGTDNARAEFDDVTVTAL